MPIKPDADERRAYDVAKKNPHFSHDALEAVINETPVLRDALISAGLVEVVKE